jgi:pimeloyl-ACP methyl ester carboxylesterase
MADATSIVDGLAITYSQVGSGPDILLLHGWGDSRRTYKQLADTLAKEFRVTAPDLPGFGASEPPKTAWDLTDYSTWTDNFCSKLELSPAIVIGHSNGGALAINAIATGKLQPAKLVLLASSGVRDGARLKKLGVKTIAKLGKILTFWLPRSTRKKLQIKLYGTVGSDMLVAPNLVETFKKTVKQDIQKDAKKLAIPTLLIYGSEDNATSVKEVGQRLHKEITGSKLQVVADAGHFVHLDAAGEVTKMIEDFIK